MAKGDEQIRLDMESLLRNPGWKLLDAWCRDKMDRSHQRVMDPSTDDRERGLEVVRYRLLREVVEFPVNEVDRLTDPKQKG